MKVSSESSSRSMYETLVVSGLAALAIAVFWRAGVLESLHQLFIWTTNDSAMQKQIAAPQWLVAMLVIFFAGTVASVFVARFGARRTVPWLLLVLVVLMAASFVGSRFFNIDTLFAPVALSILVAALCAQLVVLQQVDTDLSRYLKQLASAHATVEQPLSKREIAAPDDATEADARLASGLKLLATVLPIEEAVVFRYNASDNKLAPAARLQTDNSGNINTPTGSLERARNDVWREGVELCQQAVTHDEIQQQKSSPNQTASNQAASNAIVSNVDSHALLPSDSSADEPTALGITDDNSAAVPNANTDDNTNSKIINRGLEIQSPINVQSRASVTSVALPLRHAGRTVGALLIRVRGDFESEDQSLLDAVGLQLARDLQRVSAAAGAPTGEERATLLSVRAARRRREQLGVVGSELIERQAVQHALTEITDAVAVAYLDGTLAHVNEQMQSIIVASDAVRSISKTNDLARSRTKPSSVLSETRGRDNAAGAPRDLFALLDRLRSGVFDDPSLAIRRVLQSGVPYEREINFMARGQTFILRIALVTTGNGAITNLGDMQNNTDTDIVAAHPTCLVVSLRDVTELRAFEKLRKEMLSLMSHELRTPVTSIGGFAELLSMDERIPPDAREFTQIIGAESQRLSRMLSTFLEMAKLEGDRQTSMRIAVVLSDVVRDSLTQMQQAAKRKRIRIVEKLDSKLPPVVADRGKIMQVITNLIDNAIRYSPERTSVMVAVELEAEAVRVTVEDRGYGIPPEALDRVWEKFYRVERDGQQKDEDSTGLGLSFVRETVEQHGGTVRLESEVGRGSRFSFTLPRL